MSLLRALDTHQTPSALPLLLIHNSTSEFFGIKSPTHISFRRTMLESSLLDKVVS